MILVKTSAGNHILSTFLGFLSSKIFGFSIISFRIVSIASAVILMIYLAKKLIDNNSHYGAIVACASLYIAPVFFNYSILFRGYLLQCFLCFWATSLAFKNISIEKNYKLLSYANIIFSISFIHLPTTIYIWIPVLMVITTLNFQFKYLIKILKTLLPSIIILLTFFLTTILITGYAGMKPKDPSLSNLIDTLTSSYLELIKLGISNVFFHPHYSMVNTTYNEYFSSLFEVFLKGPYYLLYFIMLITFLVIPLYKKKIIKKFEIEIALLFISYLFLVHICVGKVSYVRTHLVYFPFIAFLIGFISDKYIKSLLKKFYQNDLLIKTILSFTIFTVLFFRSLTYFFEYKYNFPTSDDLATDNYIKKVIKENCDRYIVIDSDGYRQNVIFNYLQECSQTLSMNQIRNYVRTREFNTKAKIFILNNNPGYSGPSKFSNLNATINYINKLVNKRLVKVYENKKISSYTFVN